MGEPSSWEQLQTLQNITKLTGALHQAQVDQLKIWPLLACPHAKSSSFTWDADKKYVEFTLVLKWLSKAPSDLALRLGGLDRSVKAMLGPDWTVLVVVGSKTIFESGPDFSLPVPSSVRKPE